MAANLRRWLGGSKIANWIDAHGDGEAGSPER